MLSVRATVRTHVSAHSRDDAAAGAYLDAALAHLTPTPPRLVAVGGFSGTGKSSFSRLIAPGLGAAPGAVILRTDEVRKRLAGAAADASLPPAAYAPERTAEVYGAMLADARHALAAGRAVALDATFLLPAQRHAAEALARQAGVAFAGVWLKAAPEALARRIAARQADASDATAQSLAAQLAAGAGPMDWTRLDASGPVEAAAEAWSAASRGS
jgi:hypothetical protein